MPWLILDRDGVINIDSDHYIKNADEWQAVPGSIVAIARLSKAGFRILVATNQSGLARGLFDEITLDHMHIKMRSLVEQHGGTIEGVFYCPHGPDDKCNCRKPKTGLLDEMESEFNTTLAGSYFVGDSLKDLQVAKAKQCIPILVRTGKGLLTEKRIENDDEFGSVCVYNTLSDFANSILEETS